MVLKSVSSQVSEICRSSPRPTCWVDDSSSKGWVALFSNFPRSHFIRSFSFLSLSAAHTPHRDKVHTTTPLFLLRLPLSPSLSLSLSLYPLPVLSLHLKEQCADKKKKKKTLPRLMSSRSSSHYTVHLNNDWLMAWRSFRLLMQRVNVSTWKCLPQFNAHTVYCQPVYSAHLLILETRKWGGRAEKKETFVFGL